MLYNHLMSLPLRGYNEHPGYTTLVETTGGTMVLLQCSECGAPHPRGSIDTSKISSEGQWDCPCGFAVRVELQDASMCYPVAPVAPSAQYLLRGEETVRSTLWYHATHVEHWFEKVCASDGDIVEEERHFPEEDHGEPVDDFTVLVHVGSLDAALQRAADLRKYLGGPWFLYELRVREDAHISPHLAVDENVDAPRFAGELQHRSWREVYAPVTRYVNAYEAPGSISLIADPRCFDVLSVEPL